MTPVSSDHLAKDLTLEEFARFRDYIREHSGIYLEQSKLDSLRISLVTRATRNDCTRFDDYYRLLVADTTEFNELMNLITINETSFFRFPQQFEALRTRVLPEIMSAKHQSAREFRVWSAGCSTGEEPYSIAMTLLDAGIDGLGWGMHVLGTDVSTKALAAAQKGVYRERALLNVPPEVLARHFDPAEGGGYEVNSRVRRAVEFGYHNMIKEPYPLSLMGSWDVIFCRNVTIYFKLESTRRVVSNFVDSLNEGGYLFVGHSETLSSITDRLEPVEVGGVFLYRKPHTKRLFPHLHSHKVEPPKVKPIQLVTSAVSADVAKLDLSAQASAALLDQARASSKEGKVDAALGLIRRALILDPDDAAAHLLAASIHADRTDWDEAVRACHRALAIDPLLPAAHYTLGIVYQRQGDFERAVSELRKTLYIDQDFALAHLNIANISKSQQDWAGATREYENALRSLYLNPTGEWTEFLGGFAADVLVKTCERSLLECRKEMGIKV